MDSHLLIFRSVRLHDDKCGDHLLKDALKDNLLLFETGHDCWIKCFHTILRDIDMIQLFNNPLSCKTKEISLIKHRLQQQFRNKSFSELNQSDKLRTYKEFKCPFQYEPYLKHLSNSKLRKSLTQFRISCHRLFIETGRYSIPKIPAEDRLCKFCNLTQVEDEMHFLTVCRGWLCGAKVSCIFCHPGRPADIGL